MSLASDGILLPLFCFPDSMSTEFQPLTGGARHDLRGLRLGRYEPQDRVGSVGGDVNHDGGRIAAFQLRGADVELVVIQRDLTVLSEIKRFS